MGTYWRKQPLHYAFIRMMIMSMKWDYVSELRPSTGLLFIPRVILRAWRTVVEWCRQRTTPDSSTRTLSVLLAESSGSKQEEQFIGLFVSDCFKCRKMLRHGASGFTSLWRKACYGFLSPLKSIGLAGSEHANLGFNGKHTNHQLITISAVQDSTDLELSLFKPRNSWRGEE
jgi:hypothetical protein